MVSDSKRTGPMTADRPDYYSWKWFLRRYWVLPAFRLRATVVRVDLGPMRVYCVGCDRQQQQQIAEIDPGLLNNVAETLGCLLEVRRSPGRIRVLCLGRALDYDNLPCGLSPVIRDVTGAFWWPRMDAVIVDLKVVATCEARLRICLVHELSHALLTRLTYPYFFPRVFQEGIAEAVERQFAHTTEYHSDKPWKSLAWVGGLGGGPGGAHGTVHELLLADYEIARDGTFHRQSFVFLAFLAAASRVRGDVLDHLLADIWRRRASREQIYAWLQSRLRWSAAELEDAFAAFCATGQVTE